MSRIIVPEVYKGLPVKEIKERAFYGREDIEEIVIAEGTVRIGKFAFANSNITTITIPSSVKIIQDNAFEGCTKLAKINYEGGLEDWCKIDFSNEQSNPQQDSSFFYIRDKYGKLEKLKDILNLPRSLKEIKNYSFARFPFQQINIPEGVKKIGVKAFLNNKELEKVTLPNDLTEIQEGAFQNNEKLNFINFPKNLTHIGKSAFYNCVNCNASLVTCNHLKEIGQEAFFNYGRECTGQEAIISWKIPGSVSSIGSRAFMGLGGDILTELSIPACGEPLINYFQYDSIAALSNPFENITSLEISGGKKITMNLFKKFTNLSILNISSSIQLMEVGSFGNIPVKKISLPFINQKFKDLFSQEYDPRAKIEEIQIRSGTSIPDECFLGCSKATNIEIPNTVQIIGARAFQNCILIKEIFLNKNLQSIGSYAFEGCRLEKVYYDGDYNNWCRAVVNSTPMSAEQETQFLLKNGDEWKEELEIRITDPKAIIRGAHFKNFTKMKSFKAMYPTITMSGDIFENCNSLEEIQFSKMIAPLKTAFPGYSAVGYFPYDIPNSLQYITVLGGEIPDYAFYNCQNIETIIMCDGIKSIGIEAFSGCDNIQELNIPEGVEKIGYRAFFNCNKLSSLILPKSYKIIGEDTFNSFSIDNLYYKGEIQDWCGIEYEYSQYNKVPDIVLKNVNHFYLKSGENWIEPTEIIVPTSVKTIHPYTFAYFKAPKLIIPNNRIKLMVGAFYKYTNLKELKFPSPSERLSWYYQEHYRTQAFQSEDIKIETLVINDGEIIVDEAFYNCESLTSVIFADSIKTIGNFAFWNCLNLQTITLSKRLKSIGNNAFNSCISLTSLELPLSLNSIGDGAFNYSGIQALVIPYTLTQVGQSCFAKNYMLKKLTINNNVISDNMFDSCSALEEVYIPDDCVIGNKCFFNCSKLKKLSIPYLEGIISNIVTRDYYSGNNLEELEIRGGQSLGANALDGSYSLLKLTVGDDIKSIQQSSLQGAYNLKKLVLSKNIETLPQNCLIRQTALEELSIPKATTYLGYYFGATSYSKQYENVPESLKTVEILSGNTVPFNWITGCYNITSLILPDTLSSWPNMVMASSYKYAVNIENVYYKGTLQQWCSNITFNAGIIHPQTEEIKQAPHHFYLYNENKEWEEVVNLTIPEDVKIINPRAFVYFNNIKTLDIKGQIEEIGSNAFADCLSLTSVTIRAIEPPVIGSFVFNNTNNCPIYVPVENLEAYKMAEGWSEYADRIIEIS